MHNATPVMITAAGVIAGMYAIKAMIALIGILLIIAWMLLPKNRRCPKCGYQSAYNKYCHYDGTKMIRTKRIFKRCAKCRKEVWGSDKFCGKCGNPIPQEKSEK